MRAQQRKFQVQSNGKKESRQTSRELFSHYFRFVCQQQTSQISFKRVHVLLFFYVWRCSIPIHLELDSRRRDSRPQWHADLFFSSRATIPFSHEHKRKRKKKNTTSKSCIDQHWEYEKENIWIGDLFGIGAYSRSIRIENQKSSWQFYGRGT